jgi:nucleotide-binding universal stress UspA family protein
MTPPLPLVVQIREILFATDFSAQSEHAFLAALSLAQHFGARLHLLHVVHRAPEEASARARLQAFAEERVAPVPFAVAVATGVPAAEIVHQAARDKVDLIVMGTHGRTGLAHVVLGSVAERVMRHAPCEVLTIRKPVSLPVTVAEPPPERATAPAPEARPAGRCLVCARPSLDLICDTCKARIRAEVVYRKLEEAKAARTDR